MTLSESYWDSRYLNKDTGWDLGTISPPLQAYFDHLSNKDLKILIPGGGNSYEAEYLHHRGFKNIYVADLSKTALRNIKQRVPSFPSSHLIQKNFFDLDFKFDLIIEQTFFCALDPGLRTAYVEKIKDLLYEDGKLVGLLFDAPLNDDKPPYGGKKEDYLKLFNSKFERISMENAHNSHPSRTGKELFIKISNEI